MPQIALLILFLFNISYTQISNKELKTLSGWIDENLVSIEPQKLASFTPISQILKTKKIIAIGEAVHGSKTINTARFNFVKSLIKEAGVNNIAMEMGFNTGLKINHFIKTGAGDINSLLSQSHYFLNTSQMLEFILWLREQTKHHKAEISLYGCDIQINTSILNDITLYYKKAEFPLPNPLSILNKIFFNKALFEYKKMSKDGQRSVENAVQILAENHKNNKKELITKRGYVAYSYTEKSIEVLSNYLKMLGSGFAQARKMRDSTNAELVKWIAEFEGEKSKIALLAHNGHLGTYNRYIPRVRTLSTIGFYENYPKELLTGHYLKKWYGNSYYFIGTQFKSGAFLGFNPQKGGALSEINVIKPEHNSFNHILSLAKCKNYFIGFSFTQKTPRIAINYICSFQPFYEIGAAYDFKYSKARLISYFDAILYLETVHADQLLK